MCLTALVDPKDTHEAKVRRPSVTGPTQPDSSRILQCGGRMANKDAKDLAHFLRLEE